MSDKLDPKDDILMVCGRAADLTMVTVGTTFEHFCSNCRKSVAMSLSGQKRLGQYPQIRIVCMRCLEIPTEESPVQCYLTSGSIGELVDEINTRVTNPLKNNN